MSLSNHINEKASLDQHSPLVILKTVGLVQLQTHSSSDINQQAPPRQCGTLSLDATTHDTTLLRLLLLLQYRPGDRAVYSAILFQSMINKSRTALASSERRPVSFTSIRKSVSSTSRVDPFSLDAPRHDGTVRYCGMIRQRTVLRYGTVNIRYRGIYDTVMYTVPVLLRYDEIRTKNISYYYYYRPEIVSYSARLLRRASFSSRSITISMSMAFTRRDTSEDKANSDQPCSRSCPTISLFFTSS